MGCNQSRPKGKCSIRTCTKQLRMSRAIKCLKGLCCDRLVVVIDSKTDCCGLPKWLFPAALQTSKATCLLHRWITYDVSAPNGNSETRLLRGVGRWTKRHRRRSKTRLSQTRGQISSGQKSGRPERRRKVQGIG